MLLEAAIVAVLSLPPGIYEKTCLGVPWWWDVVSKDGHEVSGNPRVLVMDDRAFVFIEQVLEDYPKINTKDNCEYS